MLNQNLSKLSEFYNNIQVNTTRLKTNYDLHSSSNASLPTYKCSFEVSNEDFGDSLGFHAGVYFMYCIIFLTAFVGNGLVCYVVHVSPRMKTVTNYFIVNLAVGDMLMAVLCVPFSFVSILLLRYWPFGAVMCKLVNYSQAVSVFVSAYTLVAISIDRYMAIMRPLKPRLGRSPAKFVVVGVWIGAFATAAPILVVSELQRPTDWHRSCKYDVCLERWPNIKQSEQYTCALLALQFILPLTALIVTYTRIAYTVYGVRTPGEAEMLRDSRIQNSKRKMVKMMVTVVAVFVICWLPLNVFLVLWNIHENDDSWASWSGMPYVWFACHWLAMSHTCYNPFIYCYMNIRYRRGFQQTLKSLLCIKLSKRRASNRTSLYDAVPLTDLAATGQRINTRQSTRAAGPPSYSTMVSVRRATFNPVPIRAVSVKIHFT